MSINPTTKAIQLIESNQLDSLEVYKLMQQDLNLYNLFYFIGDRVRYNKDEYFRLKNNG
ncbi:hypothetical protein [Bacillus sp. AG4(2022)]|uniref:hypothetical protein n=1 Tax=Bacillus sp. AG4(2022) TaxID=2962594 RepID=UPI002880D378|nr:hypothetical protein [Bacillus sp. AG4(2022)]MDT0160380.1 hypothetical protein [Bacillus sp. AG4(2022)]